MDIAKEDLEELNRRESIKVRWERPLEMETTRRRLLVEIKVTGLQAAATSTSRGTLARGHN